MIRVITVILLLIANARDGSTKTQTACGDDPPPPAHSNLTCYTTSCIATCDGDYRFISGARTIVITCKNGVWLPTSGGFTSIPDCLAPCSPACANGRKCFQPFRECHCPDGFGGASCQDAITCPDNQTHRGCVDMCKVSCRARAVGNECPSQCFDGCACAEGWAKDDKDKCLPASNCPCYVDGVEYEDGHQEVQSFNEKYSVCTCSKQQWKCEPLEKGYAAILGEMNHMAMLDGKLRTYTGNCGYYLLKDTNTSIIINGTQMKSNSKSLNVHLPGMAVRLLNNKDVVVNLENIYTLPFQRAGLKIWHASSQYLLVQLPNGIEIHWDGKTVADIFIPPTLFGKIQGILGSYNGKTEGQYLTSDGQLTSSWSLFMESWRVDQDESCVVPTLMSKNNVCSEESVPSNITKLCNELYGPIFTECNKLIDNSTTASYYEACIVEACSCENPNPSTCSCPVLSSYASQCKNNHRMNLDNFPLQECMTECPEGQTYQFCRNSCTRTCSSNAIHAKCSTECVEGCNCPEGQSLDIYNKCIPSTQCLCVYNGTQYESGAKIVRPEGQDAEVCTCKEAQWVCQYQGPSSCSIRGDPHYRTFDNKLFSFQGISSYTLVRHKDFIIEATNKKEGIGSETNSLTIRIKGMKIELLRNLKTLVNGKSVKLPYKEIGVIKIQETSYEWITAALYNQVSISWNGRTMFIITLPGIFYDSVKGLCGTFNGNGSDDFEMPNGELTDSEDKFGNSWKVDPNTPSQISNPHPCDINEDVAILAAKNCSAIRNFPFTECHTYVDHATFYESCRFDFCVLRNETSVCPHFAAYANECRQKWIEIDWRNNITQCGVSCPLGETYQVCGDSCARSCRDIARNPECKSQCVEGCNCPNGQTLDDNGKCVLISSCPCYYKDMKYQPGQHVTQIISDNAANRSTCMNGKWNCESIQESTCQGFGDPHYITFDDKNYDFQGLCRYYLIWHEQFKIEADNERCVGYATCTKSIIISIPEYEIRLLRNREVILNNLELTTLPVTSSRFNIRMASQNIVEVLLWNNLKIQWDGSHTFIITVPPTMFGQTQGLCGTFNNNKTDDFRMSNGSYTTDINAFGDSWSSGNCNSTQVSEHPCQLNPSLVTSTKKKCNKLKGWIFSACHQFISVDNYYESCRYDLCSGSGDSELCAAMAAYAKACSNKGVIIDWRKDVNECKIKCSGDQVYRPCGSSCALTCSDFVNNVPCTGGCVEGCMCPEGKVFDDNGKCVQTFKCSCSYNGKVYKNEERINKCEGDQRKNNKKCKDEIELCTCVSGKWSCKKQKGARCSISDDKHFKTFDKKHFDFSGNCGYVLLQTNTTIVETAPRTCSNVRSKKDKCTSGVIIKNGVSTVELRKHDEVTINGARITRFPFGVRGVSIRKASSKTIIVSMPDGIEVRWDGSKKTYIDVPAMFYEMTSGMCGNFNNERNDDFRDRNGSLITNVYDLAFSWQVDADCGITNPPPDSCDTNAELKESAILHCKALLEGSFKACHGSVDVKPFYASCLEDVCTCEGEQECSCDIMAVYADECAAYGVFIYWRRAASCGGECPAGQEHHICGDSCALTCRDLQLSSTCKSTCVEGCSCPSGQVLNDNGICILKEKCPCIFDGKEYQHGDTVLMNNNEQQTLLCQCQEGSWTCKEQRNGVCSVYENKYVTMFSGMKLNTKNNCAYYLLKFANITVISAPGKCEAQKDTSKCSLPIFTVEYGSNIVQLHNAKISFNGLIVNVPFMKDEITIRMFSSVFLIVELPNGIDIHWDKEARVFIHTPATFYGITKGMCGTLGDSKDDDLITRWGEVANPTENFVVSWQVKTECDSEQSFEDKCKNNEGNKKNAERKCEPLRNIIGFACGELVDVTTYYDKCIETACKQESTDNVCNILATYADDCAFKGVVVDWRSKVPECKLQCANNQVYERCISKTSTQTCSDLTQPPKKYDVCYEGCSCPIGMILNQNNVCVQMSECPCHMDGREYQHGESTVKTHGSVVEECTCTSTQWQCSQINGGRCTNLGYSHYTTFDGATFNFLANCRYYLVRTQHFVVEAELQSCQENTQGTGIEEATCVRSVTIKAGNLIVHLKQDSKVLIGTELITQLPVIIQGVRIRNIHSNIFVSLPNDAEIWWDGQSIIRIDVPPIYMDKTEGLCGVFNGNKSDDMKTSWGEVTASLKTFAKSWEITSDCKDCPTVVESTCEKNPEMAQSARQICSILNGTMFQECHHAVDFALSYEVCMIEVCNSNLNMSYGCPPIIDYAINCADKGIPINWTKEIPQCVPNDARCPSGQEYKECINSCALTCVDITEQHKCDSKCISGCGCPNAADVLNHAGQCVPVSQCGCVHKDKYYSPTAQIIRPTPGMNETVVLEVCVCDSGLWDCDFARMEIVENLECPAAIQ